MKPVILILLFAQTAGEAPFAHISGHLVDRDSGKPLAELLVVVHAQNPDGVSYHASPAGVDGAFVIDAGLSPGEYFLEIIPKSAGVIAPGDAKSQEPDYGRSWFPGVPRAEMAVPVSLSAGENREVEVPLQKRELLHVAGVIQVPKGREGDHIAVRLTTGPEARLPVAEGEISKAGLFHIDGLDEGSYTLFAVTKTTPARDRLSLTMAVELTNHNVDDLKLTMRPAVSILEIITMANEDGSKAEMPEGIRFFPDPFLKVLQHGVIASGAGGGYWEGLLPGEYWPSLTLPPGYAVTSVSYGGRSVSTRPSTLKPRNPPLTLSLRQGLPELQAACAMRMETPCPMRPLPCCRSHSRRHSSGLIEVRFRPQRRIETACFASEVLRRAAIKPSP